jgi:hypothetical protein
MITRSYLVYRNGLLFTRTLTLAKANLIVKQLRTDGFKSSIAEELPKGGN